jgi:hypothetical protein
MSDLVKQVDISTVGEGAVVELFEEGQREVLENIRDPNTEWKVPRKIVLEIEYRVNEDRRDGVVIVGMKTKLAAIRAAVSQFAIGASQDGARLAVYQHQPLPGLGPGTIIDSRIAATGEREEDGE